MKIPTARQLPSGSWFIQLRIDGSSIPITEDTEDMCVAKAMAIKTGLIKTKPKPSDITLKDACTRYIEGRRSRLSPTTINGYELIRDNAFPTIMAMRLPQITPHVLDDAVGAECLRKTRKGTPQKPKSVKNAYSFILSVIKRHDRYFDTAYITLPEVKQAVPQLIDPSELLPAILGSEIELPCLLAIWLSLSASEIRGLTKSKSISSGKLTVNETVVEINGEQIRKQGSKEELRARAYDIPEYLGKLIDRVEGDILVPITGRQLNYKLDKLLRENDLPHIRFHDLRHLNASVMAMLNIPDKTANERGGWKSDYVRKRVYTHTFSEQRKAADRAIDSYFENLIPKTEPVNANENANEK